MKIHQASPSFNCRRSFQKKNKILVLDFFSCDDYFQFILASPDIH